MSVEQRSYEVFLILVICYSAVFIELVENVFLTGLVVCTSVDDYRLSRVIISVVDYVRTVFLRALRDSCENGCLRDSEVLDALSEVFQRSHLYTVYSTAETDIVKVFLKYLVL